MTYAQMNNNIIVNTIDVEDSSLIPLFSQGYDLFMEIDDLTPVPAIGWIYNPVTSSFSPPLTLAQTVLADSITCGSQVIFQWNALNTQGDIYDAGQTVAFLSYTNQLYQLLSLGYLSDASDLITTMIADDGSSKTNLAPFLTNDILNSFQSQIQDCLANLPSLGD
jgi:hypothetical protein